MADLNTRFLLPERNIRGQIVQLNAAVVAALKTAEYPDSVAEQLGHALAATAALASTIKLDGSIILQLQGKGLMPLLVAQATSQGDLRGLAHYDADSAAQADFASLAGEGRIVMTIDGEGSKRYQGIVEIEGHNLAASLGYYFDRSEQLNTQLYLVSKGQQAAALLLQQLPVSADDMQNLASDQQADWQHVNVLAETLQDDELLTLSAPEILRRLFHAEDVQVYEPKSLRFNCSCSREKVAIAIKGMGQQDADDLVKKAGEIRADCEFCNQAYQFDAIDIAAIFTDNATESQSLH